MVKQAGEGKVASEDKEDFRPLPKTSDKSTAKATGTEDSGRVKEVLRDKSHKGTDGNIKAEASGVDFTTQARPKSRLAGSQGQGGQGRSASSHGEYEDKGSTITVSNAELVRFCHERDLNRRRQWALDGWW